MCLILRFSLIEAGSVANRTIVFLHPAKASIASAVACDNAGTVACGTEDPAGCVVEASAHAAFLDGQITTPVVARDRHASAASSFRVGPMSTYM